MNRLGLMIVALLLCNPGLTRGDDGKSPSTKEKVLSLLQGQWKTQWSEREGKREEASNTAVLTIKGNRWRIGKLEVADIEIDPSTSPMVIDLHMKADLVEADKNQTLEGIFKIEGDKLTCCFSRTRGRSDKERPTDFSSKDNTRFVVHEFQRIKP